MRFLDEISSLTDMVAHRWPADTLILALKAGTGAPYLAERPGRLPAERAVGRAPLAV